MTFVGKILVVVQMVFSICFMAFAGAVYTAQTNWKNKHDHLQEDKQKLEAQLTETTGKLNAENDALKKEKADFENKVGRLEVTVAGVTKERDDLNSELNEEREANTSEQAVAERSTTEAEFRKEEARAQRKRNESLLDARSVLVAQVQQLEDEKFTRETELKRLIAKHNLTLEENAKYQTIIAANGFSTDLRDYEGKQSPPPNVQGVVLSAERGKRSGVEFIKISIGSDDGLLEGHDIHVYRDSEGGKYLGKISIVYVAPDQAVGMVIQRARNGSIQRGDNVTTKL